MKRLVLATFAVLTLLLPPCCRAAYASALTQTSDGAPDELRTLTRDELDVVKVLTMQEDAWNRGDLAGYMQGYKESPGDLFIGQHVTHGFGVWQIDERHAYPDRAAMGTLAFSAIEPHVLDEHYAVVLGRYHLDRSKKGGGPADGMFSLVLEKTDKGWKIILDHTT